MQECHPSAYKTRAVGEHIGFPGLLVPIGAILGFALLRTLGRFTAQSWRLLAVPFGIGLASEALVQASWAMAARRGFKYGHDTNEASWDHEGKRIAYRYARQDGPPDASATGKR